MKCYIYVFTFLCFFLGNSDYTYSNEEFKADTLSLYENKSGIGIKTYLRNWFFKPGTYSYNISDVTGQDSVALNFQFIYDSAIYVKLYDLKNELMVEGLIGQGGQMYGDIKFYKEGHLSRIEHWDTMHIDNPCGGYLSDEMPSPCGTWLYFKNGKLIKTKSFEVKIKSCAANTYERVITTIKYSRKGKMRRIRQKKVTVHW